MRMCLPYDKLLTLAPDPSLEHKTLEDAIPVYLWLKIIFIDMPVLETDSLGTNLIMSNPVMDFLAEVDIPSLGTLLSA